MTSTPGDSSTARPNRTLNPASQLSIAENIARLGPFVALVLAIAYFSVQSDRFLSGANFSLILQQSMVVGVLAIGQTIVILTAGIDLSVGAVMSFSGILMTRLAVENGLNPFLATIVGLLGACAFGLLNGLLITQIRLPPFIVTLGTLNIAFALTHIYSENQTQTNIPDQMTFLGNTFKLGGTVITYGIVLMFALYIVAWYILKSTAAGRHIYAVGDNPEAARRTGIHVNRLLVAVYVTTGLLCGIAALLLVARTGVGDPNAGQTDNLSSITAVVLGGASLFGGRGSVLGTLVGLLIIGVIRNGLQLTGVDSIYQVLVTGILVIVAVTVDQLARRNQQ